LGRLVAGETVGLMRIGRPIDSVAKFGCGAGMETLALVHALGPLEVVGIDLDERRRPTFCRTSDV
jgi:predicted RNA methylase